MKITVLIANNYGASKQLSKYRTEKYVVVKDNILMFFDILKQALLWLPFCFYCGTLKYDCVSDTVSSFIIPLGVFNVPILTKKKFVM